MRLLRLRLLQTRRGLALITTLGCVALATLLVMALLSTADVGRKEASTALDLAIAHLGVDNALQQVKAQLLSATTARSAEGRPLPWTSQPGAIRVYQQDGSLSHIQKLYTAAQATATDPAALANDLPADWAERFAHLRE